MSNPAEVFLETISEILMMLPKPKSMWQPLQGKNMLSRIYNWMRCGKRCRTRSCYPWQVPKMLPCEEHWQSHVFQSPNTLHMTRTMAPTVLHTWLLQWRSFKSASVLSSAPFPNPREQPFLVIQGSANPLFVLCQLGPYLYNSTGFKKQVLQGGRGALCHGLTVVSACKRKIMIFNFRFGKYCLVMLFLSQVHLHMSVIETLSAVRNDWAILTDHQWH